MASFPSIRIEGGLFGSDLLDQIVAGELKGQKPADFGLDPKRNLTDEIEGFFKGKLYLIHDRDPLYTAEFLTMLADAGIQSVKFPARSPNLKAYASHCTS